jgi:hypothetical protein
VRLRVLAAAVLAASVAGAAPAARTATLGVRFDDSRPGRIVVATARYRLTLSKTNGAILGLTQLPSGTRLVRGSVGCLWGAVRVLSDTYVGGCTFRRTGGNRFRYAWDGTTLTLRYDARAPDRVEATATLRPHATSIDLRLTVRNGASGTIERVHFPADLVGDSRTATAGYVPTYLPGVRLRAPFFREGSRSAVSTYPSRYAFADYLALDARGGRLAVHGVNPPPSRIAPVALGFTRNPEGQPCSADTFCIVRAFETWIRRGEAWRSATVRLRVGDPVERTIRAYRVDNGIDRYPSVARKLGSKLAKLARAPLVKADLWKGLPPFRSWESDLRRLPRPSLVHPVAFQPGGHDEGFPDFLPPDPSWGSTADLRGAVAEMHRLGHLAMPYLNVSWWDEESPTVRALPRPAEIATLDQRGQPVVITYADKAGIVVSPFSPVVRDRVARLLAQWRAEVPTDCLFFDQIGARPWLRDFNPAAPNPLAYDDGWLALMAPYRGRCLMVEDGWDRLAASFAAFHGGALMLAREHDEPDVRWGEGNWEPWPLATWLLHDKVLFYQHDLFAPTLVHDDEVVTWNVAFGLIHSLDWDARARTLDTPWPQVAGVLQRALGPRYVGKPLASYRRVARDVTESVFGDLVVRANWSAARTHVTGVHRLAKQGFLARTRDGAVVAGAFSGLFGGGRLSPGVHYIVVERTARAITVRHPSGADTDIAISVPRGARMRVEAVGSSGERLGPIPRRLAGGRVVFHYAAAHGGRPVAAYRLVRV